MHLRIGKIEDYEFYIDKSFRETEKIVNSRKKKKKRKKEMIRYKEISRVINSSKVLINDMDFLEKAFPTIENLSPFYQELIDITISCDKLKKSISSIKWVKRKIEELKNKSIQNMEKAKEEKIVPLRKSFYGRINSIMKKINKDLKFMDEARKKIRNFPIIKPKIKTFCIIGYPNVGKSTLLRKLTTAKPEINKYPFTTKGLMIGYIDKEIQLIDTPGTFNRPFKEMNYIEKQAYLAIKYLSKELIYIFDLSESCGYSVKDQEKLMIRIKNRFRSKNFMIFFSKKDLVEPKIIKDFIKNHKDNIIFSDGKKLKKKLESE